ncbi:MAG: protoheme IX farnesyltransferase [Planctomycetota bacterium]|nr:MAG: protoheme IX farnesyltransferase [Planctomycetota bacterium]
MNWLRDLAVLGKLRIQFFAIGAALVSLSLALEGMPSLSLSLRLTAGLLLVCGGAAALNQALEADTDALMERTRVRPIPAGRMAAQTVFWASLAVAAAGCLWLAWQVDPLTGALAALMVILYDFVYTPLKRRTSLNTLVGAVPGAFPVLLGWSAAGQGLNPTAWVLFGILFVWQFPHFMAVAWLLREDYRRAGLRMISVGDIGARLTGRQAANYALLLVPVSLLPSLTAGAGSLYIIGALSLSLAFLATSLYFWQGSSFSQARLLMRASLLYLPSLLALMVVDLLQAT